MFQLLKGFMCPSFGTFSYYFQMDVIKVSKQNVALLNIVGYICLLCGSQLYNSYLKHYELRTLMKIGSVITICLSPMYLMLVFRKNLQYGIPDAALIIFDESVGEVISQAFIGMPVMVLYAKITPPHIEATCFALLASSSNLRSTI